MSEESFILQAKKNSVDLVRLGVDSTWYKPDIKKVKKIAMSGYEKMVILNDVESYNDIKRYMIAQALIDNIAYNERGLSIRWALPFDFSDRKEYDQQEYDKRNWYSSWNIGPFIYDKYEQNVWVRGGNERKGSRDVFCLWGIGRGFNSTGVVQSVRIKRANVKIIEVVSISQLKIGEVAVLATPTLFKRGDVCHIDVGFPYGSGGKTDEIIIYGFICEALGARQTG